MGRGLGFLVLACGLVACVPPGGGCEGPCTAADLLYDVVGTWDLVESCSGDPGTLELVMDIAISADEVTLDWGDGATTCTVESPTEVSYDDSFPGYDESGTVTFSSDDALTKESQWTTADNSGFCTADGTKR